MSYPLKEVNEMCPVYCFSVQRGQGYNQQYKVAYHICVQSTRQTATIISRSQNSECTREWLLHLMKIPNHTDSENKRASHISHTKPILCI